MSLTILSNSEYNSRVAWCVLIVLLCYYDYFSCILFWEQSSSKIYAGILSYAEIYLDKASVELTKIYPNVRFVD